MATTISADTKPGGLIRGLRTRLQRPKATIPRTRVDDPRIAWDPLLTLRTMMRWDPFSEMREAMHGYPFRPGVLSPPLSERETWIPCFDVKEDGHAMRFVADVPGVSHLDIEIAVIGDRLTVSGNRSDGETAVHRERPEGHFARSFILPSSVDVDRITSELRGGVLTIVAPLMAGSRSRKIPVTSE